MLTEPNLASLLISTVRACGSSAQDVRTAAHEASCALELGIAPGVWDRETIRQAVMRFPKARRAGTELLARAVEAEICRILKIPYNQGLSMEEAVQEAVLSEVQLSRDFPKHVEEAKRSTATQEMVARILEMAREQKPPVRVSKHSRTQSLENP